MVSASKSMDTKVTFADRTPNSRKCLFALLGGRMSSFEERNVGEGQVAIANDRIPA